MFRYPSQNYFRFIRSSESPSENKSIRIFPLKSRPAHGSVQDIKYPKTLIEGHDKSYNIVNHTSEFKGFDISLLDILNLNNILTSTARSPWKFESDIIAGIGWSHDFNYYDGFTLNSNRNKLIAITGFREGYNFGKAKEFQIYLQPSVKWNLTGYDNEYENEYENGIKMNKSHAYFGLQAGFIYKFRCSNGTHNFKIYNIDLKEMNNKIDSLRKVATAVPKVIKDTVTVTDSIITPNNPYVICFAKNSYELSSKARL